jgi:hypothetical protein
LSSPRLQAGGTLNPRRHVYIERPEDAELLRLLRAGEYVNVLTPRQMGKSSLMGRTLLALRDEGVRTASIDLAAELGSETEGDAWFKGLVGKLARELGLKLDVGAWWTEHGDETAGQRLQRFFSEFACAEIPPPTPIVVFLDEIDNTLKHVFTDGLFTAIRGMYNERSLVPAYEQVTFCLLGVATPNELIKDHRTTAYNVGRTLALRDFDQARDDLSPLLRELGSEAVLARILHWTGGQPYLTVKLAADLKAEGAASPETVDAYIERVFASLEGLRDEIHFQQILRIVESRLSQGLKSLAVYKEVLEGRPVRAETAPAHLELELSGLVRRDASGRLALRNPIYARLFDRQWLATTEPMLAAGRDRRRLRYASAALATSLLGAGWLGYSYMLQSNITRGFKTLAARGITITGDAQSGVALVLPDDAPQALLGEALAAVPDRRAVRRLDLSDTQVANLTPLESLTKLQQLDLSDTQVANLTPFESLAKLQQLDRLRDLAALEGLAQLQQLDLSHTQIGDIASFEGLTGLQQLYFWNAPVANLASLQDLAGLQRLDLSGTQVTDLSPLQGLTELEFVALANTPVSDAAIASLRQQLAPPRGKLRAIGKQSLNELERQLHQTP